MATHDPRHDLVRMYLAAVDDLDAVIAAMAQVHADARASVRSFEEVLREVPAAPQLAPAAVLSTASLWRPLDAATLTGLTDLWDVVGRMTFQGPDDANLTAMRALASTVRAEIDRQRASYAELARVPDLAHEHATALEERELATSRAQQAELLQQFEPAAAQLREIAQKLIGAMRAEKKPDLAAIESAEAHYQEYVTRVRGLYARALPYLRTQLAELCRIAGVDVPQSWPDTLPFAPTLPPELVAAPAGESPVLAQVRQSVEALTAQEAALVRAQDELGVQLRRAEGELSALAQREGDALKELNTAKALVRLASKLDELDGYAGEVGAVQAEGQARTQTIENLKVEIQRANGAIQGLQKEATDHAQLIAAKEPALEDHRREQPALLGRDTWRRRLEQMETELDELRAELTRRQQAIVTAQLDVARLQGRVQNEQGSIATLARRLAELKTRESAAQAEVARIEQELGAARPARRVSVPLAEEALVAIQNARNEARARVERVGAEMRRIREDMDRAAVQLKQVQADRERAQSAMGTAQRQASAAVDEALRTLASRRAAAFESHAQQVLSGLEDSLAQVDRVFIDPARRALLVRAGVMSGAPDQIRSRAVSFGEALAETSARSESAWAAQVAVIDAVEREFLARIAERCRAVW